MVDNFESNEKRLNPSVTRPPTGRYHVVVTYLNEDQIQTVLKHYRDYIDSALYIEHNRDKKHTEQDMGVLRQLIEQTQTRINEIDTLIDKNTAKSKYDANKIKGLNLQRGKLHKRLLELEEKQKKWLVEKDELKESHWHVLIKFYTAHTSSAVLKYFTRFRWEADYFDEDGNKQHGYINSRVQMVDSVGEARDYLTHKNEPFKERYLESEVLTYGRGWECFNQASRSVDGAMEIVDRIIEGESWRQLAREYGRDVIYHAKQWKEFAGMVQRQEASARIYVETAQYAITNGGKGTLKLADGRTIKIDRDMYNQACYILSFLNDNIEERYLNDSQKIKY